MSSPRQKRVYVPRNQPTGSGSSPHQINPDSLGTLGSGAQTENAADLHSEIEQLKKDNDRQALLIRLLLAVILFMLSIMVIFWLPVLINWRSLLNHENYNNIRYLLLVISFGSCWLIVDKHEGRRLVAVGSVVLAAVVTLGEVI